MSGRLVVLDRAGRAGKRFPLATGLATLGRGAACDIRVLRPEVSAHHATITVHANQTVVRHVGSGVTLVNGAAVSVRALRHGDELALGGRRLRWEYDRPHAQPRRSKGDLAPALALASQPASGRVARRGTLAAPPRSPDRHLQLALELRHRASMPASSTGGKQVAIVQPQRRDTNNQDETSSPRPAAPATPPATPPAPADDQPKRKLAHSARLHTPTKATLWIESRRGRARSASLRRALLRRPASDKIQAPTEIDHTKQAAIMLMTGHTPRSKLASAARASGNKATPSFVAKRRSPLTRTPRTPRSAPRAPRSASADHSRRSAARSSGNHSVSIFEITDSDAGSVRRTRHGSGGSPALPGPKKSALKDPRGRGSRKTESIKFDLSNLDSYESAAAGDEPGPGGAGRDSSHTDEEITLHYSDSSPPGPPAPPSPRRALHSRSSRMLEHARGSGSVSPREGPASRASSAPASPAEPRARRPTRGSLIVQKALEISDAAESSGSRYSRRTTASAPGSAPRRRALEAYSIVDLVSDASAMSEYNSAASGSASFGTPGASRTTLEPTLLGSSTPLPRSPANDATLMRSPEDLVTPDEAPGSRGPRPSRSRRADAAPASFELNSTEKRSRSRLDDTVPAMPDENSSLKSMRNSTQSSGSQRSTRGNATPGSSVASPDAHKSSRLSGTPERRAGPAEAGTPVLSIRSLLDASGLDITEPPRKRARPSAADKRKTFANRSAPRNARGFSRSKSLNFAPAGGGPVTPTGAVTPESEPVKTKHSSAKKSRSRRTIIDTLEDSGLVRHLFGSPVKRKLSQSMSEFSRELRDGSPSPPRCASALSPGVFVSPLSPGAPPDPPDPLDRLDGVRRLFRRASPRNELRDLRGVRRLLRTPRARRSIRDDLCDVAGVKAVFAKSPRNRLSDVRGVKELFAAAPRDDLRRVSGVRALFRSERDPRDDLTDVRGVRALLRRPAPRHHRAHVSAVKDGLRIKSPKNDLRDVRGVKRLYRRSRSPRSPDLSGVARLLHDEPAADVTLDRLAPRPRLRPAFSKSFTAREANKPARRRRTSSPRVPAEAVPGNVERWLQERAPRARRPAPADTYTAHTLPFKKRSVVDASPDGSLERRVGSPAERPRLPIKKRALVHSTPLKGAAPRTRCSGLGRDSPIAAPESPKVVSEPPEKPKRTRTAKAEIAKQMNETTKPSPKKTRAKTREEKTSRVRATRSRAGGKTSVAGESAAAVAKKTTSKEPKSKPATEEPTVAGRKRGAPRRPAAGASPAQPARGAGRGRARRASLQLPRPSPQLKPQPPRARRAAAQRVADPDQPTNKHISAKTKSPKESLLNTNKTKSLKRSPVKAKKAKSPKRSTVKAKRKSPKPSPVKANKSKSKESPVKAKRATRNATAPDAPESSKRKTANTEPKGGKRKIIQQESDPGPRRGRKAAATPPKKGRKAAASPEPASAKPESKRGRAAAAQETVSSAVATRGKRARAEPAATTRRNTKSAKPATPPAPRRTASGAPARARSAKRGADVQPQKNDKKQKGNKTVEVVAESEPRGRKRKNDASSADKKKEPSPKKPRGRAAAEAAPGRARALRTR